jgi:ribosomal protein S18 acetylase RimI-like enzyme
MKPAAAPAQAPRTYQTEIRAVGQEHVACALLILREASQWLASRGLPAWSERDLQQADLPSQSATGCLILGFMHGKPTACMLLQSSDPLYWPRATRGSALYLHKLAVSRAHAGCGWGPRMIAWAKIETRRQGIRRLRLDTWADSPLIELYEAHGFRRLNRVPHLASGSALYRMECLLQTRR